MLSGLFAAGIVLVNPNKTKQGAPANIALWLINTLLICALAMGGNELYAKISGPQGTPPKAATSPPPDPGLPKEVKPEQPRVPFASSVFSPLTLVVDKNASFVQPPVPVGDGGHLLQVNLSAPSEITGVDFECRGEACGWVYQCPDGGTCAGRPRLEINGSKATWFAWSNSGAPATLIFRVHYK
jgi:hypothetical protein